MKFNAPQSNDESAHTLSRRHPINRLPCIRAILLSVVESIAANSSESHAALNSGHACHDRIDVLLLTDGFAEELLRLAPVLRVGPNNDALRGRVFCWLFETAFWATPDGASPMAREFSEV